MRWAQLTLVEDDPGKFDPQFWLDYFKRTKSDAVCLSAGGCVAYYPTEIPFHHRSQWLGSSDPFGELVAGCRKLGMVVIARTDPHATYDDVRDAHPDWIAVDANGNPRRHWASPEMWVTCAFGPYNFEFMTEVQIMPAGWELASPMDGIEIVGIALGKLAHRFGVGVKEFLTVRFRIGRISLRERLDVITFVLRRIFRELKGLLHCLIGSLRLGGIDFRQVVIGTENQRAALLWQSPRGQDVQSPRSAGVAKPSGTITRASTLIKEAANTLCFRIDMRTTKIDVRRAVETGQLGAHVDVDVATELLVAPLFYRRLVSGERADDELVDRLVAAVWAAWPAG